MKYTWCLLVTTVYWHKSLQFTKKFCKFSDAENEVDLTLTRAGIFKTPKDIDDLTICPTHRSNLGVGWSRGSNSRCRVPKEVFGHGEGRVKSIPIVCLYPENKIKIVLSLSLTAIEHFHAELR